MLYRILIMKVIDIRYYFIKGGLFMGTELRKGFPEFLEIIEYTETFVNGYKLEKVAMFNSTVVSTNEVQSWIEQGILDIDTKPTVVVMTKKQYENLFDHVTFDNLEKAVENTDGFYEDLRIEQQGGIQ